MGVATTVTRPAQTREKVLKLVAQYIMKHLRSDVTPVAAPDSKGFPYTKGIITWQKPITKKATFDEPTQHAFPTEARLQQKAKLKELKDAGLKPNKRNKYVEDHYDDCGEDLSGIPPFEDEVPDTYLNLDIDGEDIAIKQGYEQLADPSPQTTPEFVPIEIFANTMDTIGHGLDVIQLFGG